MRATDLAAYRPQWVEPIAKHYGGHALHEIRSAGHRRADLALGIRPRRLKVDGVNWRHLQIEAMKLAFADVYRYVCERDAMEVTTEQMLDDTYLASRARRIADLSPATTSRAARSTTRPTSAA